MFKFLKDYQMLLSSIILGSCIVVAAFRLASARRYSLHLEHSHDASTVRDRTILFDTFTGRRAVKKNDLILRDGDYSAYDSLSFDNLFQEQPFSYSSDK